MNGTLSPSPTPNSPTVVKSSPRSSIGVRSSSASGPGDRADAEILPPHPRHHLAVAEAHDQLGAHPDPAAHPLHHADQVDVLHVVGARHEVDHQGHAFVGLEGGLEDRRAGR